MKLIVGLGNPGQRYERTRHNVGFRVVDELASRWGIGIGRERFHAWAGDGEIRNQRVLLLKPTTFMNRSGQSVLAAGRFYRSELADLLVVLDDFSLPLGRMRVRPQGSAGSHNGLSDIIERLGTGEFARLRVGIGNAVGDPAHYVLERFSEGQETVVRRAVLRAADAAECWLENGPEVAMNQFNGLADVTDSDNGPDPRG